ncbi:MAG: phosphodiester glycosidase family protein, partial [Faecousia sp.]
NGEVNMEAYNNNSGYNPRTAIGQREDGAVIFICIDGRQAGSLGGTYADIIDIMVEYKAVNACNMDGGSSSVMMYRDNYGRYGDAGEVVMINNYSLLQSEPRRMPNFWMVRPAA